MKRQKNQNIYKKAQRFADVTKALIINGNIHRAKRCLQIAENMMTSGSKEIQNAITNVYVYSLSSFMDIHRCSIKDLFPKQLQSEYHKQVNTSGI